MLEEFKELIRKVNEQEAQDTENRDFILDAIEQKANAFVNYVEAVYNMEITTPIIYAKYEGEEIRDKIQNLDEKRRMCHETAIGACNFFNRQCDYYELPRFCPDTDDRYVVADFVGEFVNEVYLSGTKERVRSMDDMIKVAKEENCMPVPKSNMHKIIEEELAH